MTTLIITIWALGVALLLAGLVEAGYLAGRARGDRDMEDVREHHDDQVRAQTVAAIATRDELDLAVAEAGRQAVAQVMLRQSQRPPGPHHAAPVQAITRPPVSAALTGVTDRFHTIVTAESWEPSHVD